MLRKRSSIAMALALAFILSSVPVALAKDARDTVRDLRAQKLAERRDARGGDNPVVTAAGMAYATAEEAIPVISSAYYKDAEGFRRFDGHFGTGNPADRFYDVWVLIEFYNASNVKLGEDETLANEYVIAGEGTWSAELDYVPTGTTQFKATVYGTRTDVEPFVPTAAAVTGMETLPTLDRFYEGTVVFGTFGVATDPRLSDLAVSGIEERAGVFWDVVTGYDDRDILGPIEPGYTVPWFGWAPRASNAPVTQRFLYSAVEHSDVSLATSTTVPAYGASVKLTGRAVDSTGNPVPGMEVIALTTGGAVAGSAITSAEGTYTITVKPSVKTGYQVFTMGSSFIASAASRTIYVDPKVYLTAPSSSSVAYLNKAFTSASYLKPRHTAGTYPVLVKCYLKVSGKWVLKKTVKAKAANYSTYTKTTASIALPYRGSWMLQAYHDDAGHYPTTSSARYLTVK